jgi:hypothetical protein
MLWLFVKRSSRLTTGTQRRRIKRQAILLLAEVDGMKGVKGLTDDLSLGGCRMNMNLAVRRGQHLTLRLHLPGEESPIVVEQATVRWVLEKNLGLQFMSLPSRERERLGEVFGGWHNRPVSKVGHSSR